MPFINGTEVIIPAPAGYEVNFANPPQIGKAEIFSVIVIENILAFAFLCQRLYTKLVLMRTFQIEDGMYGAPNWTCISGKSVVRSVP